SWRSAFDQFRARHSVCLARTFSKHQSSPGDSEEVLRCTAVSGLGDLSVTYKLPPVGADVNLLLAASSYVKPLDGNADPKAVAAFIAVCDAFCNGADLLLPLPRGPVGRAVVPFYDLWKSRAAAKELLDCELTDEGFQSIAPGGALHFVRLAEAEAWD